MSAVITKKTGGMVRSREDHTISGTLDVGGGRRISYSLPPNQKVAVEPEVFAMLKHKFGVQEDRLVPDHDENARNPHQKGAAPAMRPESKPTYILEFYD